jgi:hypothetical protein
MIFRGVEGHRRKSEEGACPICSREEDWRHVLKCEEENIWRDDILDKRFTNADQLHTLLHLSEVTPSALKSFNEQ